MAESYDEWERKHIGAYLYTRGQVWWCGDYWCDCTQAQVDAVYRNRVTGNSYIFKRVWEGPFYTDGESGARADLQAFHDMLAAAWPEGAAQIRWSESVDTDDAIHGVSDEQQHVTLGPESP